MSVSAKHTSNLRHSILMTPLGGIDCSMPPPPTMTPKRYEWRVLMIVGGFVDYAVPQRAGKADLGLGG